MFYVFIVIMVVDMEFGFMSCKFYVICEDLVVCRFWMGVFDYLRKEDDFKLNCWKDV